MKLKPIHAIYAALLMAFALGGGSALGTQIAEMISLGGFAGRLLPAVFVTLIAAVGVYVLQKRTRFSFKDIGLTLLQPSLRGVALGVLVNVGILALVFVPAVYFDLITISTVDTSLLVSFLLTNVVVAFLLEAFPEEVTMRGVAYSSLRSKYAAIKSVLIMTGLFMLVPGLSTVFAGLVNALFDGSLGHHIGIAPEDENVIDYLILLFVFSLTLAAARLATYSRTIWTSILFHLTFLTANRILIQDSSITGVNIDLASPDVILLVPLYTALAGAVYYLVAKKRRNSNS